MTQAERAALTYLHLGCSVLPLRPCDKIPILESWKLLQLRRPTENEVRAWYRQWPNAGVGIIGGRVSGLAILDIDPRNGGTLAGHPVPRGPAVLTGGGGEHYYLGLIGERVPKIPGLLPGVDLQGEGSYAVAPPSVHPSGVAYRWMQGCELGAVALPGLPSWLRLRIAQATRPDRPAGIPGGSPPLELAPILFTLEGVRRGAGGWVARCPAHDDHSPSLSIGSGQDGRILLHCFRGCSYAAIRTALERRATDEARP
jgi:hypothetical protein